MAGIVEPNAAIEIGSGAPSSGDPLRSTTNLSQTGQGRLHRFRSPEKRERFARDPCKKAESSFRGLRTCSGHRLAAANTRRLFGWCHRRNLHRCRSTSSRSRGALLFGQRGRRCSKESYFHHDLIRPFRKEATRAFSKPEQRVRQGHWDQDARIQVDGASTLHQSDLS